MLAALALKSQDIHFSQFYAAPFILNPANTGNYNGDWRVVNNYRNQWRAISKPYNTLTVGYDQQIYIYNQNFSGGIFFLSDKAGAMALSTNKIFLTTGYHKYIKNNYLHFGLQIGYVFKSYNYDNLSLPSQFDMSVGSFNNELPSNEANLADNTSYPDINTGVIWERKIRNFTPRIGIALFHLNAPRVTYIDKNSDNRLGLKQNYFVESDYQLTERIVLTPRYFMVRLKKTQEQIYGSHITYLIKPNQLKINNLFGGLYARDNFNQKIDALIIVGGVNIANFDIGINYDINLSGLKSASNYRGAFEISIIYKSISTFFNQYTIPCTRL